MKRARFIQAGCVAIALHLLATAGLSAPAKAQRPSAPATDYQFKSLRSAICDLTETFGPKYPRGPEFLARLDVLEQATNRPAAERQRAFESLKREALLANPLLDFGRLLVVKRKSKTKKMFDSQASGPERLWQSWGPGRDIGLPSNHECNSSLERTGYDNEIAVLSPVRPDGQLTPLYRPDDGGYVGEVDVHWDADRLLFTKSDKANWKIWEIRPDGTGLRRVSQAPDDVDCFDACYLPDGRIILGSTAAWLAVPCWHGLKRVTNLFLMNADGTGMRQLCFDQDHDLHATVQNDGQVLFHRWDYTGISHIFLRELMVMNPDGTGQRAIYGSNSWYPNSLYFPRAVPGCAGLLVSILSGYHGVHRMGQLVLVNTNRGWHEADGLTLRMSGQGQRITPMVRDNLVDEDWPRFLHPYPLSDKYFLVSAWTDPKSPWGVYLADVFDNLVLVREEPGYALLEPLPIRTSPRPPVIPDRVDLSRKDGTVYLHNVYAGPGLDGVPRGTVKSLRVLAYHFGYPGLAGPDIIGCGGPWEAMRILGTAPLEADGSAAFRVPANTPVAVQALDGEGKAVQLMRSWFTVMPGETLSCTGCHESPGEAASARPSLAALRQPRELTPWHGPPRGFDFAREVQPVLDRHCVACHDGQQARPDLRTEQARPDYQGRRLSDLAVKRMHPKMLEETSGVLRYTPAYDALVPYVRRVGIEDDVSLLVPGEYHANTSELVQLLAKGHAGVRLDAEAWDRLVTWIDLNGPCHGTWGDAYPIPDRARERRMELSRLYGGAEGDPEAVPTIARPSSPPVKPPAQTKAAPVRLASWPLAADVARQRQTASGRFEMTLDLGDGVTMKLVRVPAGEFVMGDADGEPDEQPPVRVAIQKPYWIGACEVSNAQFRRFDPGHQSRYYVKRHFRADDQGLPLDEPPQPVVRVSWEQAMEFCRWLSGRTGMNVTLPTEAQWEYACRAGSAAPLFYGAVEADFSRWANVADQTFVEGKQEAGKQITGGLEHLVLEGAALSDTRFRDQAAVTAPIGSYQANAWGLCDMHGNAAEWTRSRYQPYPYRDDDGRNDAAVGGGRVVRGGSFFDRPARCRSAFRLEYPAWQRVFNVGFRVMCETEATGSDLQKSLTQASERLIGTSELAGPAGRPISDRRNP